MRFKTSNIMQAKHTSLVSCVGWVSSDNVISIGDDRKIFNWNLVSGETNNVTDLSPDFSPTDMELYPKTSSGVPVGSRGSGRSNTVSAAEQPFLLTSAEGKLQIMGGNNGRIERVVEAHRGACLTGRWSHDGTVIATGGEEGTVKIWSKSAMLRTTLAQTSFPIYAVAWSPDSSSILFASGCNLTIKSLTPSASKPLIWKAHDGIILCVDWSCSNHQMVSGAEDCRYRVWDSYGRQIYSSYLHDYPITSVAWSMGGELLAIGSFNTLRLCDKLGWSHSLDKPNTGSIYKLAWSDDGTQVAGACGNNGVIFAHVIEQRLEWKDYEATITSRKMISLRNITNDAAESLDFHDRIIKVSLMFNYLIVATTAKFNIYTTKNWNTPIIHDLREGSVSLIIQAERHFLLVDGTSVYVYSYEGRLLCNPKWPGSNTATTLNNSTVSLSCDTIAIRDQTDEKIVHFFDVTTGKRLNDGKPFQHRLEISEIALDNAGLTNTRKLAFVDKNRDLFLTKVRTFGTMGSEISGKLGSMVQSLKWSSNCNILASIQDARFITYIYPSVIYVDKNLLARTMIESDSTDFTKQPPSLVAFVDNTVSIRRADGTLLRVSISPYVAPLHFYVDSNRWTDATRLCRFVQNTSFWASLAGMALCAKHLETAEMAYSAIQEVDKVLYIQSIRSNESKDERKAEIALLMGKFNDAENIYMQCGLAHRAIMLNVHLHRWERALDLAIKNNSKHIDVVLAHRMKYLKRCDMRETNTKLAEYAKQKSEADWEND